MAKTDLDVIREMYRDWDGTYKMLRDWGLNNSWDSLKVDIFNRYKILKTVRSVHTDDGYCSWLQGNKENWRNDRILKLIAGVNNKQFIPGSGKYWEKTIGQTLDINPLDCTWKRREWLRKTVEYYDKSRLEFKFSV